MERKKKICKSCKTEQFIFSKGRCLKCTDKKPIRQKTPLKKVTGKQLQTVRKYLTLRKKYLEVNPRCEVKIPGCTIKATEIHHSGKKYSESLWLDTSLFVACCRHCHELLEKSPDLAKKLNLYNYKI